ncbi:TetR/AcrR family transcriptional regulator [Nitratifractor sp.]
MHLKQSAERGLYKTTIPDIAEVLKISLGNLYNYFNSMELLDREILRLTSIYLGWGFAGSTKSASTTGRRIVWQPVFTLPENTQR